MIVRLTVRSYILSIVRDLVQGPPLHHAVGRSSRRMPMGPCTSTQYQRVAVANLQATTNGHTWTPSPLPVPVATPS